MKLGIKLPSDLAWASLSVITNTRYNGDIYQSDPFLLSQLGLNLTHISPFIIFQMDQHVSLSLSFSLTMYPKMSLKVLLSKKMQLNWT